MQICDINLERNVDGFPLLANSIHKKQLKSLIIRGKAISDSNILPLISEALPNSNIEILRLENSDIDFHSDLHNLVDALPKAVSLKQLEINGYYTLNKTRLIDLLEYTQIEYLALVNVRLIDQEATHLGQIVPLTKLKRLDVRYNPLRLNGANSLLNAVNAKPGFKVWVSQTQRYYPGW